MNRSSTLAKKITYLVILLAMLFPLYLLGQPAGGKNNLGGRLSEMRHEYNIAESDLGEISPASETMKLASLGLRGVAATLLWNRAHRYRVQHEWDRLKATLNNIALLQPHFDKVWEHQAHNLAYNVSTEFDDYRQRYAMVREGTEFLTKGVRQNTNAPRLVWYTGWFYGAKLGMSDEKTQFRRLFSEDEVLHKTLIEQGISVDSPEGRGPLGKPDNWLAGRLWLNYGYELVDNGIEIRRQTPLNFYETGPKWRFKHAEAIEDEGVLDSRAQNAWQMAAEDWQAFGERSITTTSAFTIKLDQLDILKEQREEKIARFRELAPEAFDAEKQRLTDELPEEFKEFWQKPESELTYEQRELLPSIRRAVIPNIAVLAPKTDASVRLEAVNLVGEVADLDQRINKTEGYRTQINYVYWKTLAQAEQEKRTVEARRLIYEAENANADAMLDKAIELYEKAFVVWAEILDDYPVLVVDDSAEDLFESIRRYMIAIDSEDLPEDFPLREFAILMSEYGRMNAMEYEQAREMRRNGEAPTDFNSQAPEAIPMAEPPRVNLLGETPETSGAKPETPTPETPTPDTNSKGSGSDGSEDPQPDTTESEATAAGEQEEPAGSEAESPDVESPDVESPDVESPDVESPEAEAETSEAEGSGTETSEADSSATESSEETVSESESTESESGDSEATESSDNQSEDEGSGE